jgi:hypothetical protein
MAIKTFSDGISLPASDINSYLTNSGLVYVTSATAGTAVSSVTVSSCFSATYDNYRIVISGGTASASGNNATFQFSGITGSVYQTAGYFVTYGTPTVSAYAPALGSNWLVGFWGLNNTTFSMDVMSPNLAKYKGMSTLNSSTYNYSFTGEAQSTSIATGFVLGIAAGTFTGQTITVYGYRKA